MGTSHDWAAFMLWHKTKTVIQQEIGAQRSFKNTKWRSTWITNSQWDKSFLDAKRRPYPHFVRLSRKYDPLITTNKRNPQILTKHNTHVLQFADVCQNAVPEQGIRVTSDGLISDHRQKFSSARCCDEMLGELRVIQVHDVFVTTLEVAVKTMILRKVSLSDCRQQKNQSELTVLSWNYKFAWILRMVIR